MKIWLDGKLVEQEEAKTSVFDHGTLYGDGIFEGIRFYNKRVFRLEDHMDRLYNCAHYLLLDIPYTQEELSNAVCETVAASGLNDGYIPVISTVAQGADAETAYNINADTAAARIAASLGAESWRALVRACPAASICLRTTAMEALSSSRRSVRCSMRSRRLAASSLREQTSSKEGPYFIFRDSSRLMRSSSWKSSRGSQSSSAE